MAASSTINIVKGAGLEPSASSTVDIVKGAGLEPSASSTINVTKGPPIPLLPLIRGLQFEAEQLRQNIFEQPLLSILSKTESINLKTIATTSLYTATGLTLIHGVVLRVTTGTAITADATVSAGVNPSTTNLFSAEELIDVRALNDIYSFWSDKSTTLIMQNADVLDLRVTIAATGSVLIAEAHVIGTPI
jgi:hypothetical protein